VTGRYPYAAHDAADGQDERRLTPLDASKEIDVQFRISISGRVIRGEAGSLRATHAYHGQNGSDGRGYRNKKQTPETINKKQVR